MFLDEDGRKAIMGCKEGSVNYILFDTIDIAKERQQFKVDISKIMFSRDSKKFAFVDAQRELVTQFDRDHWLQFSFKEHSFEIKNPETGSIIPVQLENLNRYKASYEPKARAREDQMPSAMVEVVSHPLFWHDANQYFVIRDDEDHVHLTRTKVQMDMAVANSITGEAEGNPHYKYEPQQGKFLDVFIGPN